MPSSQLQNAHDKIALTLKERIGSAWMPGDRLPPLQALADELGIGLQTAHRAMRILADTGLVVSRPRHGTFIALDALSKLAPRGPLHGKRITVASRRINDGMVLTMADEVSQTLINLGAAISHTLLSVENTWDIDPEANATVIINPNSWPPIPENTVRPIVVISTAGVTPIAFPDGFDTVTVDQEQGGVIAGRHLKQTGVKRPLFLAGINRRTGDFASTSMSRLRGFELGFGQVIPDELKIKTEYFRLEAGAQAVARYLAMPHRPDGIFAASDELAVGFVLGGLAHGISPGVDYQIIGFDKQNLGANLLSGALTSVEAPSRDLGHKAAELLTQRILDPSLSVRRLSLGCSLSQGVTTASR